MYERGASAGALIWFAMMSSFSITDGAPLACLLADCHQLRMAAKNTLSRSTRRETSVPTSSSTSVTCSRTSPIVSTTSASYTVSRRAQKAQGSWNQR